MAYSNADSIITQNIYYDGNCNVNSQYQCITKVYNTATQATSHDWSIASDTFLISVNGGAFDSIVLNANCASIVDIVSHINTQLKAKGISNVYAFKASNSKYYLRTLIKGSNTSLELRELNASVVLKSYLRWRAGNYSCTLNKVLVSGGQEYADPLIK